MFVMSYFKTDSEALHLATSDDALNWTPLRGGAPILQSSIGAKSVRDPHLSRAHDGTFHLFFTDGWTSNSIVHSTSRDLLNWSEQRLIEVMAHESRVKNCWAPECFYDHEAELYRIIWSSTVDDGARNFNAHGYDHRIWGTSTTDFQTYSRAEVFFDPGFDVIDASVVYHDGEYWMTFKDERGDHTPGTPHKMIHIARSRHALGPWNEISKSITPAFTEGPTMFRRGDEWILFFDHFTEGIFGAVQSRDCVEWTNITSQVKFPPEPRHASVIEVDEVVAQILRREIE